MRWILEALASQPYLAEGTWAGGARCQFPLATFMVWEAVQGTIAGRGRIWRGQYCSFCEVNAVEYFSLKQLDPVKILGSSKSSCSDSPFTEQADADSTLAC